MIPAQLSVIAEIMHSDADLRQYTAILPLRRRVLKPDPSLALLNSH